MSGRPPRIRRQPRRPGEHSYTNRRVEHDGDLARSSGIVTWGPYQRDQAVGGWCDPRGARDGADTTHRARSPAGIITASSLMVMLLLSRGLCAGRWTSALPLSLRAPSQRPGPHPGRQVADHGVEVAGGFVARLLIVVCSSLCGGYPPLGPLGAASGLPARASVGGPKPAPVPSVIFTSSSHGRR